MADTPTVNMDRIAYLLGRAILEKEAALEQARQARAELDALKAQTADTEAPES